MAPSFTSVVFLGPSTELNPICTVKYPKFTLPILNEPLLLHNLRWMDGVSTEIIVIGLERYKERVHEIVAESMCKSKITFIGLLHYDGTYHNLKKIIKDIKTTHIIITKGDIISFVKLKEIVNAFLKRKTGVFVILKRDADSASIVGYNEDSILFYNNDCNNALETKFFLEHSRTKFSVDLDIAQVYIMRVKVFEEIEGEFFSFKSNLFPMLVNKLGLKTPVRFFFSEDDVFQVQKYADLVKVTNILRERTKNLPFYLHSAELHDLTEHEKHKYVMNYNLQNKNFIFKTKNRISFPDDKNIVGRFLTTGKSYLKNATVGNDCEIGDETLVEDSIVFNNVKIGNSCKIRRCLIGSNVTICDGCVLMDCKVTSDYVFSESVNASGQVFIGNEIG
ncbi:Translation initiation factor 2B, gamma subunit (eIF-2Bgamma/GCD1) [Trachipleistophora hominis]|uniref:Translation initiation factor eIF2B subunit gamma n=1 Tax=Trachipleistophora hominis TaxID=72359 RepID=L7JVP3_TRAHO|nr:Translation initiation factor 2B, gamma subunit (eIF-2Bgamma/GCD1) [Trachipleistophora hominis]